VCLLEREEEEEEYDEDELSLSSPDNGRESVGNTATSVTDSETQAAAAAAAALAENNNQQSSPTTEHVFIADSQTSPKCSPMLRNKVKWLFCHFIERRRCWSQSTYFLVL